MSLASFFVQLVCPLLIGLSSLNWPVTILQEILGPKR
jgi:hypothetical protein